jgi:hypothetical protein
VPESSISLVVSFVCCSEYRTKNDRCRAFGKTCWWAASKTEVGENNE